MSAFNLALTAIVSHYDNSVFYQMNWRAKKLLNTDSFFDFWDKSDPYIKFMKIRTDNSLI